jgi:LAO/AO transport system kinase
VARDIAALVARAVEGDRASIAKLITTLEAGDDDAAAAEAAIFPHTGQAYTVGLTGAPGAGKSSITDALVRRIRKDDLEVGVLAIDPTSPYSGGAILGDRVRMQDHATDPGVYIRSMATRGHLGGLALATPRAARVLDAAGKPWIIVETVGVGQVEVEIAGAADTTVVVVNPGWGDGVQANKAGLMEIADLFVVNKADREGAAETIRDLEMMLDLSGHPEWRPRIVRTVATRNAGIDELWDAIREHREFQESDGRLARRREARLRDELESILVAKLQARAAAACSGPEFDDLVRQVEARTLDPHAAVELLLLGPPGAPPGAAGR